MRDIWPFRQEDSLSITARALCGKEVKKEQELIATKETSDVVIREVVKIRYRYCSALYDEVSDNCPCCGERR
jgi:hypothetical protein